MRHFELGQNSLEVCQSIISDNPIIEQIKLIAHVVRVNWRQVYDSPQKQASALLDGLKHENPLFSKDYNRGDFLKLSLDTLPFLEQNQVWSMTSKVLCYNREYKHIPMMNFHPEGNVSIEDIILAVNFITKNKRGILLNSGRYTHYYGDFLLDESEWPGFLGEFLAPCILVSPRYISHRLHHGYCSLRLTADFEFKPKIPDVIHLLP